MYAKYGTFSEFEPTTQMIVIWALTAVLMATYVGIEICFQSVREKGYYYKGIDTIGSPT